ncbi:MAG: hypothetical protein ACYC8T_09395 [Myxococcaceae bacterium]
MLIAALVVAAPAGAEDVPVVRASARFSYQDRAYDSVSTAGVNIGLHKRFESEVASAEAVASINVFKADSAFGFTGNSSFLRFDHRPQGWDPGTGIGVTVYPFSSKRLRLANDIRLSRGDTLSGNPSGYGTAVKGEVAYAALRAFAGLKTGTVLNDLILEREVLFAPIVGVAWVTPALTGEAKAARYPRGLIPGLANQGTAVPVTATGASARIEFRTGAHIGPRIDFGRYGADPEFYEMLFTPDEYPAGISTQVSFEATHLWQELENPEAFGQTRTNVADGAVLDLRLKAGRTRVHVEAMYRSLSLIQFDAPGIPPFKNLPAGTLEAPEIGAGAGCTSHRGCTRRLPRRRYSSIPSTRSAETTLPQALQARARSWSRSSTAWSFFRRTPRPGPS